MKLKVSDILVSAVLLVCTASPASAQFWSFGNDPSSASWSQITTDHFKLIYPDEIDSLAREYLRAMEYYRPLVNEGLGIDPLPVPVILHPYTTMSNGMVAWCPKSVHLITSPNPYSDSQTDWKTQLVTHEMRHVAQSEHYTRGFYRYIYPILGESITGVGMALFALPTYLEGDATITETLLTDGGRGRMASFLMQVRTDYLTGRIPNVEGHLIASYHYKPYDKYAIGYMAMGSEMIRTANYSFPGEFYRDKALKLGGFLMRKSSRPFLNYDDNFREMQKMACKVWREDDASRGEFTPSSAVSPRTRLNTDYTSGIFIEDTLSPLFGSIVALKSGMEHASEMVCILPDGRESHLKYHASVSSGLTGGRDGRLYWSESVMHDAPLSETFSEIKYYDLRNDRLGTLTRSTKYFNPSVSPSGDCVAAAEYPIGRPSRLVLVSAGNGDKISDVPAPEGGQIQETVFLGRDIYATVIGNRGVGIWKISETALRDGIPEWEEVLPAISCELRNLSICDGRLCFASDIDGLLNIYSYDTVAGELRKLTNSRFGANHPFSDAGPGALYYSDYTDKGYRIVRAGADSLLDMKVAWADSCESPAVKYLKGLRDSQSTVRPVDNPDICNPDRYPSKHYNKFLHAFKIHSWAPLYYNVDRIMNMGGDQLYQMVAPGAVVYSQNELGNVKGMLGYSYHGGFHSGHAKVVASIADLDVEARFDINDRNQWVYEGTGSSYKRIVTGKPFCEGELTVDYPLNLYHGGWNSMFVPSVSWRLTNDTFDAGRKYCDNSSTVGFRYYRMLSIPTSGIYPRWGYSISAYHNFSLNTNEKMPLSYVSAYAYFPGILRTHGLKVSAQAQYRHTDSHTLYYNNSYASLPRGYLAENYGLVSRKYAMLSADYAIPIWLGDLTIPYVFYFKRLQLIPFADYALEQTFGGVNNTYWSAGSDLRVDFSILRFRFELSCGVRYCYTGPQGDFRRHNVSMLFGLKI